MVSNNIMMIKTFTCRLYEYHQIAEEVLHVYCSDPISFIFIMDVKMNLEAIEITQNTAIRPN